jgi:hypothetical protein
MSKSLALVAFVLTLAAAHSSQAGRVDNVYPNCVRNADGSGYCNGTLDGFRNYPGDSTVYASFSNSVGTYTYKAFNAHFNGQNFGCNAANSVPDIIANWPKANLGMSFYFEVDWNSSGVCTYLSLGSVSYMP